jgi:hypothetical protein
MATTTTTTMPTPKLTQTDSAILSALFDPESSPSSNNTISISDSSSLPLLPNISPTLLPTLRARETLAIRPLNHPYPTPSAIETAIHDLSSLISAHPVYAPAYLNRAQATRLRLALVSPSEFYTTATLPSTTQLFSDLNTAITLTTPSTPTAPVSPLQADLLANAHTHRGYLLLKAASTTLDPQSQLQPQQVALPPTLTRLSSTALEELASRDFALGGRYGNKIARQLSVQTNPYAKACGAIVKEALRKEREEFAGSVDVGMEMGT